MYKRLVAFLDFPKRTSKYPSSIFTSPHVKRNASPIRMPVSQTKNSNVLKGLSSHLQVQSFLLGIQNELTWLLTRQHSDAWNTLNQFPLLGHT